MTDPQPAGPETPEVLEPETPATVPDPEPSDDPPPTPVTVVETPEAEREPDPSTEQRTTAAVVPYERPQALVPGTDMPIIPAYQEMQGMAAMAVTLAGADAVPAALRNKPNDVFQVLLTARDLGVAITTGMREFHVIEGKVTLSPKVKLAMVNERGHREGWAVWPDPANDAETATWYGTRKDRPGLTFSSTFTMDEARRVKNGSKTLDQKENWQSYPKRMLSWRALGYLLDDVFPEVGTGLYSPDELGAMTDEHGDVIDIATTEPLAGTKAPRGHGPKEPDAGDQPLCDADPDLCADLRARLDAIGTVADARAALLELWKSAEVPPFAHLLYRHRAKALALVQSVEARLRRGEWGSWDADPLGDPPDAPTGDDNGQDGAEAEPTPDGDAAQEDAQEPVVEQPDAQDDTPPACEVCGVPEGAQHLQEMHDLADVVDAARATTSSTPAEPDAVDEAKLVQAVIAEVSRFNKGAVVRELATRGYASSRDNAANQRALGAVLLRERGGTVPDHEMPPRMPDSDEDAQPQALALGGADRAAGTTDES